MRKYLPVAVLGIAAAAMPIVGGLLGREHAEPKAPASRVETAGPVPAAIETQLTAAGTTSVRELVLTLSRASEAADVAIDGGINVDASDRLAYDLDLRHLFDYLLGKTRSDEELGTVGEVLVRLAEEAQLPPEGAEAVLAAFQRYIDYRRAVDELELGSPVPEAEHRFEILYELRRSILGREMADGFFAEEEAQARYLIETRRTESDPTLDAEEREARLQALEGALPPALRETRRRALRVVEVRREVAALREQGAGEEAVYQLRAERLGPDAAERLRQLELDRAAWRERLASYRRERDAILSNRGLSPADRKRAVEALLERRFSDTEARRVRALDRVNLAAD